MASTSKIPAVVGLDIGGTRIKAVALSAGGGESQTLGQFEGPSATQSGPQAVRRAAIAAVNQLRAEGLSIESVGVGCAGSVDSHKGIVRTSPNFAAWKNVPLGGWLSEDLGVYACVNNDANCAVFCEWKLGNAKGANNVVLLTLGTGIGGGLVLGGRLYRGSTGTAGELGHFSIRADGIECPCGNRGCFERYCSASALRERAGSFSAREIFSRASEPYFSNLVQTFLDDFKIGLTSLANIFDPDCILIGGGVANGLAHHFPMLESWLRQHAFPSVGESVRLRVTYFGNLSGAIGAALLSREKD